MGRVLLVVPLLASLASALWPKPVSYSHGDTVLWIAEDVAFNWAGASNVRSALKYQDPNLIPAYVHCQTNATLCSQDDDNSLRRSKFRRRFSPHNEKWWARANTTGSADGGATGDDIVDYAIKQAHTTIFDKGFVPWKFRPRGWDEPSSDGAAYIKSIDLDLLKDDPENVAKPLAGDVDESYTLAMTEDGKVSICANSTVGLARGLTTFTQFFFKHSKSGVYTTVAPVEITDSPKFSHRGINLDVARQWYEVDDIKRMIDAAAYNKMNRFHLHVTDSQSWPLEIPALPDLSAKGAYRPDLVYSVDEFQDMQKHAAVQGIEFITEIDQPGHTSSIAYSSPDLIAAFNKLPNWDDYAAEPPSGTLKLNSSGVSDFLETLFDDLLPRVLPFSAYFHTGGDEVNKNAYNLDDTVQSNDSKILQPLMQKFVDRNHDQVRKAGLTPIVWEEMLLDWNLTLGSDVIVQSWQSDEALLQIVNSGHKGLAGNYLYWYLDCGKGQWLDFDPSVAAQYYPFQDYCAPFHNWRLVYSYDPLSGIPEDKQHLVVGGEAHMWSEQTDPVNLDRMVWPRAAAAAEILWSGAKDENGQNRSQIDASPRLSEMRERLVAMGIGAEPIQMPYCTMDGESCAIGYSE